MSESAAGERIGELLLREGRLSEAALERALEAQRLVGGRLGTNLLELDMISESALIDAIGRQRKTSTAGRAELSRISPAVLRSVPEKLARRYRLIPYEVRGKTLFVASSDPGDLLWEDEIAFLTSFMVRTCIALELHVMLALRQHYKIPVDRRFLSLAKRLRSGKSGPILRPPTAALSATAATTRPAATQAPTPPSTTSPGADPSLSTDTSEPPTPAINPAPTPRPPRAIVPATPARGRASLPVAATGEAPDVEFIELDADDLAKLRGQSVSPPTPLPEVDVELAPWLPEIEPAAEAPPEATPAQAPSTKPQPQGAQQAPGASDLPAGDSLGDSIPRPQAAAPPEPSFAETEFQEFPLPFEEEQNFDYFAALGEDSDTRLARAALALQEADIRDEIGDVLLGTSGAYFTRRLLLIARRGRIIGWRGVGEGIDEERIRALDLDKDAPSIFAGLRDPGSFWLGPLPQLPANIALVEALGDPPPRDCLVLPVTLRSKVVCHLYADNHQNGVGGAPLADMKRLTAQAGLAFEVYILKNKIRML